MWIEIICYWYCRGDTCVALFTEGVDWNMLWLLLLLLLLRRPLHRGCGLKYFCLFLLLTFLKVALFTEGVDWNTSIPLTLVVRGCRPLHRGCGLKLIQQYIQSLSNKSPSSQRVWIEIQPLVSHETLGEVALFTEGVDWNVAVVKSVSRRQTSPSSQRVWIEIVTDKKMKRVSPSPSSQRVWIEIP